MWGTPANEDWKPRDGLFLSFLAQSRKSAAVCSLGFECVWTAEAELNVCSHKEGEEDDMYPCTLTDSKTCTSGLLNILDSLCCAGTNVT